MSVRAPRPKPSTGDDGSTERRVPFAHQLDEKEFNPPPDTDTRDEVKRGATDEKNMGTGGAGPLYLFQFFEFDEASGMFKEPRNSPVSKEMRVEDIRGKIASWVSCDTSEILISHTQDFILGKISDTHEIDHYYSLTDTHTTYKIYWMKRRKDFPVNRAAPSKPVKEKMHQRSSSIYFKFVDIVASCLAWCLKLCCDIIAKAFDNLKNDGNAVIVSKLINDIDDLSLAYQKHKPRPLTWIALSSAILCVTFLVVGFIEDVVHRSYKFLLSLIAYIIGVILCHFFPSDSCTYLTECLVNHTTVS